LLHNDKISSHNTACGVEPVIDPVVPQQISWVHGVGKAWWSLREAQQSSRKTRAVAGR